MGLGSNSYTNHGCQRRQTRSAFALFHLATLAASVSANPLAHIDTGDDSLPSTACADDLPSPTQFNIRVIKRAKIPDKYERDSDGFWRPAGIYTLYGSTICPNCVSTPTVSSHVGATANPTSLVEAEDILDTLPDGWKPTVNHKARDSVVVAVSLALAIAICTLMALCVAMRKTESRVRNWKDAEMRLRELQTRHLDEGSLDRDAKQKQRSWKREIIRWKANARYMFHRRRGRRVASKPARSSTLVDPPEIIDTPLSTSALQEENLTAPEAQPRSPSLPSTSNTTSLQNLIRTPPSCPPTPVHLYPPTYQRTIRMPPMIHIPFESSDHRRRDAPPIASSSTSPTMPPRPLDDVSPPYHAAHVATDDKHVLARLSDMASSPPSNLDSDIQVSAPAWNDLTEPFSCPSSSRSSLQIFPLPPPPRVKVTADYDYDSFDDLDSMEPILVPSVPPIEEGYPSAPPFDMAPSAPPLADSGLFSPRDQIEAVGTTHDHDPNDDVAP